MAFQTMPYLFQKWGPILSVVAGVMWFGLLFFAGVTSSLAMGTPWMGFMEDEFNWGRKKAALSFGLIVLCMGLPTVLFYKQGVFDEYDYWAGTVSLVVFALLETVLFAWIFGMEKGWKEINSGADIKIPIIYKYIIKFVTPLLILFVFLGSLITPKGNDWSGGLKSLFSGNGWQLDNGSLIKQITNSGLKEQIMNATDPVLMASLQERLQYINMARIFLLTLFVSIAVVVYIAYKKRVKEGRVHV
jgi:NSS family neurotransmitter:Na+ symporter